MSEIPKHIRYCMLYEFQLGNNASARCPSMSVLQLGEGIVADCTCRHWFKRFQEGDLSLEIYPTSGRPLECDMGRLQALIENNPRLTTRELSIVLGYN